MKFGKQLQTGVYKPWQDQYMAYGKYRRMLKRYQFLKEQRLMGKVAGEIKYAKQEAAWIASGHDSPVAMGSIEKAPLIPSRPPAAGFGSLHGTGKSDVGHAHNGNALLTQGLIYDAEGHEQFIRFERQKSHAERETSSEEFFGELDKDKEKVENFFVGKLAELEDQIRVFEKQQSMQNSWAVPSGSTFINLRNTFTEVVALQKYVELNKDGFRKIVKKYDKLVGTSNLDSFMENLKGYEFTESSKVKDLEKRVEGLVSRDKLLEMKYHADKVSSEDSENKALFPSLKLASLFWSLVLFALAINFVPDLSSEDGGDGGNAERCLAMLVLATSLWVTEAIPYFVTALLVPVLVVFLDILEDPSTMDGNMTRQKASHVVLGHMVNHTTVLIMGGYSISAAFSRCEIELRIASVLQGWLGHRPGLFILSMMYLGLFLSMLISNHTAPVLCVSILLPVIKDLNVDSRFGKALLLGLAFACNFGGMVTPISSMQNVVAAQTLENAGYQISFGVWITLGIPFCSLGVFVAWVIIMVILNPSDVSQIPIIIYSKPNVLTRRNIFIVSLTLITIFGWSTIGSTEDFWGDLGIISLVFIVIVFGVGLLSEIDFNSFSWHTLFLLGGGNVLGKAISSSHLLDILAQATIKLLPEDHPWLMLVEVVTVVMFISTFVSHTVASIILMPLIVRVGIDAGMPVVLGMASALAVSGGCALPFSSFPNVTSLFVVDDFNRVYLKVIDFVKCGLPMSVATIAMISTLGYILIEMIVLPAVTNDINDPVAGLGLGV